MDPYTEQRLRDEVIYLHSLWHHGHPTPPPPTINLHPSNPPRFKKPHKKTPKFKPKKAGSFSGKEWPVNPPPADPPLNQSGWPELKLKPKPQPTRLPTPEEIEKYNWNQIQQQALKSAKEFYSKIDKDSDESDDEDEDDDDDDDDDDMSEDGESVEDREYEFFWKLFNEYEELKGYYVKRCGGGGGEFLCLVCGGANEKQGKRFKDCIAMVQHSVSIAKTKKRRSHRAYGKVVCKVLGWDIDRLPSSIVLEHKSSELQGKGAIARKDVNSLNNVVDDVNSNGETHDVVETVGGDSMVCEDISVVANVEEESNKNQVLNEAEGQTGGAVNNLCRNLSSTMVLEPVPCDLQTN